MYSSLSHFFPFHLVILCIWLLEGMVFNVFLHQHERTLRRFLPGALRGPLWPSQWWLFMDGLQGAKCFSQNIYHNKTSQVCTLSPLEKWLRLHSEKFAFVSKGDPANKVVHESFRIGCLDPKHTSPASAGRRCAYVIPGNEGVRAGPRSIDHHGSTNTLCSPFKPGKERCG